MKVEDILRLDEQITVLYGKAGLNRRVSYIDVVEIPEGIHWTNAGDFIITTGYCFAANEALLELMVRTLIRRRCAGLGIKIGRYIDHIPERVIEIVEEHSFPLIRIPMHFSYREISRPLLKALAESPQEFSYASPASFYAAILHGDLREEKDIRLSASRLGIAFNSLHYIFLVKSDVALDKDRFSRLGQVCEEQGAFRCRLLEIKGPDTVQAVCDIANANTFTAGQAAAAHGLFGLIRSVLGPGAVIVMSAPCYGLMDINQAGFHAAVLLGHGLLLYPDQKTFLFSDYFIDLFLWDNQNHYVLNSLYRTYIEPLLQADRRQNSRLLPTLLALSANSFSITETGQALYLHRNTVYNRIKQIEAILGPISGHKTQQALLLACKHYHLQQADSKAKPGSA